MDKDELKKIRVKINLDNNKWKEADYGPYYKTLLLFITNKCNLNCKTCFNKVNLKNNEEMSFEYIKKIIDNNPLIQKYDIMGGEPLLHPQINKILNYLDKKNKKIGLYTNGLLLNKFYTGYKNLKLNLSFHSIQSSDPSLKPIENVAEQIIKFQDIYPIKICYLISKDNAGKLMEFASYVETKFDKIKKLTIGALRDETDYWNNDRSNILPLEDYEKIIKRFFNDYSGNLNVDFFTEGVVFTKYLPKSQPNQINRFKCIFANNKFTECLYDVGIDKKIEFNPEEPIKFCDYKICPKYKRKNCLTDKVKLLRIKI